MTHCTQHTMTDGTCCASQPCRNTDRLERYMRLQTAARAPYFRAAEFILSAIIMFAIGWSVATNI